ncbi:GntR family transcriptional regulator [Propionibacterium freudenreichii]|uniref:Regulatory protein GntR, HTH n=1 Tax=Propionibacterium freudenreichii subsp. shermanii (strain ATCC 9614 / DSM 4902 / CIP 103027 / NCIMB 8099 / CIRM-BIA1) TaxID=754252 RepID=D7GG62_PROFC|nr:GntR family transcriptional regulator [Propionibacterium freudenreichii]MCQ1998296.1 GntR family transcriptional regulator [Propionibacterium freudenreichii]CBL57523.1 Regulatory protein GntR, HTH [Propionibacterium freudenreichii subsp. shermanii CIRM-BIA1]
MHIDAASPTPVFEQIIEQLRRGAVQGSLPAGTRLPAVRALAGELGVAVNTVAKAYRQLEAEGTVVTGGRNGTTIAALADAEPTRVAEAARTLIARARDAELSRDQALGLVARLW